MAPSGLRTSTCVVTSKVRQVPFPAAARSEGNSARHGRESREGDRRPKELTPIHGGSFLSRARPGAAKGPVHGYPRRPPVFARLFTRPASGWRGWISEAAGRPPPV
ncbi:MAG: hypothetical protein MZV63_22205 [Marinilabiliales bacterium]|nr:hypothetical protein [Marinilabiliales bacterium]